MNKQYEFHDTALSRSVEFARHAVAIDERRAPFKPTLWSNVENFNTPGAPVRVAQSWFPGDHGGVGGGPCRGLSNCALLWVLEGAEQAGLMLSREPGSVLSNCLAEIDPITCSVRSNKRPSLMNVLGARWRKGPTRFEDMHETARLRWAANASYRPAPLAPFADDIMNAVREERAA
jgi:uncharacterized protein (DUF2235 family)